MDRLIEQRDARLAGRTMPNRRSDQPENRTAAAESSPLQMPDATFDRWLTHHLRQLYDPVTSEPIPADLLRLLERRLS
jgi:hypothetical protein